METATRLVPERRLYEVERRELVEEIEAAPRALYNCDACNEEFFGPNAAHEWVNHLCQPGQASIREEIKQRVESRNARETTLLEAARNVIEHDGYEALLEALGNECERQAEEASWKNADSWRERALALFEAAKVGEDHDE